MSSEREPLLTTSPRYGANVKDSGETKKEGKKLGPLEISRSNRWAILVGVWTANLLGVRRIIFPLISFAEVLFCVQALNCVYSHLTVSTLLDRPLFFSHPGGNLCVVKPFACSG